MNILRADFAYLEYKTTEIIKHVYLI